MADKILQVYGSVGGGSTFNDAANVDIPQKGVIRKVNFMTKFTGSFATDMAYSYELSFLPTNRFDVNGDYGNVIARQRGDIEVQGTDYSATIPQFCLSGLEFRVEIAQRLYLHIITTAVLSIQVQADVYIDV